MSYLFNPFTGKFDITHDAVTLKTGHDAALSISGQELDLADVLTPTEHTNIGTNSPHHAPVTVSAPISLSTQALSLINNAGAPATVTAIDVGTLASSDTVIPTSHAVVTAIAVLAHARSHALDSTSDHSIGSLTSTYLVKSDGSKLAPATNTDSQVSAAVTASHAAITLAASADVLLGLSTQALSLDTQNPNIVLAGPVSGAAVAPTFRSLVNADIPNILIDRSNPSAYDKTKADWTINAWTDWDLHLIVPTGARYVMIRVNLLGAANHVFGMRKNGDTNDYNTAVIYTQVAGVSVDQLLIVGCDTSQVIEYYIAPVVGDWTNINAVVRGWIF